MAFSLKAQHEHHAIPLSTTTEKIKEIPHR
jgi:hypothetical protein